MTAVSHRLGEVFSVRPSIKDISEESWKERMPYDHNLEITRPWYYSTYLIRDGITVEFTPGKKTGVYRFTFPGKGPRALLLDVFNGEGSFWHFLSGSELEGQETWQGGVKVYLYGMFNTVGKPGTIKDGHVNEGVTVADHPSKAFIRFSSGTDAIEWKYAISFVSAEQAKRNWEEEIKDKNFETVKRNAAKVWDHLTDQVQVEGGTEAQRRSFYTALYRCSERMVDISEDGQYYSGYNKQVNKDARDFYVDDWSWDTYLALHPLRMILHPGQEQDMLQSYVRMYQQSGWMPSFPVLFGDYACMNAFHSSVVLLDAYRKGLRNFDVEKAYEGMRRNTLEATLLPWRNGPRTVLDSFYQVHGYFPALRPGETETVPQVHPFEKRQAVAVTLGASFDDWALAQLAKDLGKMDDYRLFSKRAENYKNLWNPERQFFLPKDDKGDWINIDPKFDGGPGGRDYYDENNGWTYLWQLQQDIPSLTGMLGGKKAMEARLDQLFREDLGRSKQEFWNKFPDATALVGEYSMANEPCFHIPYLYNYAGAPWKTQKMIRLLLSLWFKDNVFGIPGDEDGGGMSAFVVFSSMGFYPVELGKSVYTIGSPVFSKVTIALENGKQFTLIAHHSSDINKYIQSARMNGVALTTPWFTHEQLMNGGTLELEMGPKPNKEWGAE
jgi:predicted alpha-1,2-mannosidase